MFSTTSVPCRALPALAQFCARFTEFLDEWSTKREEARRDRDRLRGQIISSTQAGRQRECLLTAGQTAGGISDVLPVAEIMRQLVAEAEATRVCFGLVVATSPKGRAA